MTLCIDTIRIHRVARPLRYPWRTAYGEDSSIDGIIVEVRAGKHSGWGEAAPLHAPTYSPETAGTCFHVARDFLAPRLLGARLAHPAEAGLLLDLFRGNPFAKSALEMAVWNLFAQAGNVSLAALLGGKERPVEAGADFGVQDSLDMLLEKVGEATDAGFGRIKLKIRPGWDREVVRLVCDAFPRQTFHVDCNASYSRDDLGLMRELDGFGLAMIEQPFGTRDLIDHAWLQARIETPVCLDESVTCVHDFEQALALGACRMLNVKIGRTGGIATAVRLHDMARDAGIPCWVGSMLESGIGMSALIALATLPNFAYPGDLFPTAAHYENDVTEKLSFSAGCRFMPAGAGEAPHPDAARLDAVTAENCTLETRI